MFCLKCKYPLHARSSNTCPECGKTFDPDNSSTYLVSTDKKYYIYTQGIFLCVSVIIFIIALFIKPVDHGLMNYPHALPLRDSIGMWSSRALFVLTIAIHVIVCVYCLRLLVATRIVKTTNELIKLFIVFSLAIVLLLFDLWIVLLAGKT